MHFFTGNHAIACFQAPEDYYELKIALGDIIKDVNDIIKDGTIKVNGNRVKVRIHLGGDYKVLDTSIMF